MTEYDNDLLKEGILRFKSKEFEAARRYLQRALDTADDNQTRAQANYYLSRLTDDPAQKRQYLEETLAIDMAHAEARRELAILDGKLNPAEIVNPDALPTPPAGTMTVQTDRFTCPKGGGRMVYSPDGVSLICEYCNRNQRLSSEARGEEQDFFIAMADGKGFRKTIATKTFRCQGCGARFILPPNQLSATCACCGSAHVIVVDKLRELVEPDAIVPMAFDRKQAARYLMQWVKRNHIQPQGKVTAPYGLYLPVWTFDITGSIPWNGHIVRDKQKVPVSGERTVNFDDLPVPGARTLAGLLEKTLPGFGLSSAPAYDPRYLAGWPAEIYELTMSDASLDARQVAVEQVRSLIRAEFGHVQDLNYDTSAIMVSSFKLVLVPVWVTAIAVSERTGRVLINGLTGSVHSDLPGRGLSGWLDSLLDRGSRTVDN
jgi:hypothetical protein